MSVCAFLINILRAVIMLSDLSSLAMSLTSQYRSMFVVYNKTSVRNQDWRIVAAAGRRVGFKIWAFLSVIIENLDEVENDEKYRAPCKPSKPTQGGVVLPLLNLDS